MESILKELEEYITNSHLLDNNQKQDLLDEIKTIEDEDLLDLIKIRLEKENEFTIKYLKHIVKDYKEINVFELKTNLGNSYVKYIHSQEATSKQMDLKETDLMLDSIM